jgi:hypothetical protein
MKFICHLIIMKMLRQSPAQIAALSMVSVLAACSGTSQSSGSPGLPLATFPRPHAWMAPNAVNTSLLYVSDASESRVEIYSNYKTKAIALQGQITGLQYPYGECVDKAGNVYVTEQYGSDVVEFAHGGTTPIKTLSVTGGAIGCAVDPTSGNLAVAVYTDSQGYNTPGGVFIFQHATGSPTLYQDPHLWQFWPPGYDPKGNLFVQGYNPTVELVELARGGSAFQQISLGSTNINAPGGVMWDGKYLAVDDQQYQGGNTTAIYRVSIAGTNGTVVSKTLLTDSCYPGKNYADVIQPWVHGSTIIGGNHSCKSRFGLWSYPGGGNPTRTFPSNIAPVDGVGEAVSPP